MRTVNLRIADELLGTRNCVADERKRINEIVSLKRFFARCIALITLQVSHAKLEFYNIHAQKSCFDFFRAFRFLAQKLGLQKSPFL